MKTTLFKKLFAVILLITVTFGTLTVLLSYSPIKNRQMDNSISELKNIALSIKGFMESGTEEHDIKSVLNEIDSKIDRRITIISQDGKVLADTRAETESMDNHISRPEIMMAMKKGFGVSVRYSKTLGKNLIYAAVSYTQKNGSTGVVRVSVPESDIRGLMNNLFIRFALTALILIIIASAIGLIITSSISRPINQLAEASSRIGRGDFSTVMLNSTTYEIDRLAGNFNKMVQEINRLFTELNLNRQMLSRVLESTQEAMCVIDQHDTVSLWNEQFRNMFSTFDKGNKYWHIIKNYKVTEMIKKVKSTGRTENAEIEESGKWFSVLVSPIGETGDTLLSMYNFTEIKNLQIVKKEFVMNVSHELKTPLTAIKGFVETIEDDANDEIKHFLEIIRRHTDRLIHIVSDLLVLSESESSEYRLDLQKININTFLQKEMRIFERMAAAKGLMIELHADDEPVYAEIDVFAMEQVFTNLVENALKYTEQGNVKVTVRSDFENVFVDVADTGPGIEQEHLERIFERFYVVDKSRTRETGGTGLGLSIVKHIALLHGGSVSVKSTIGQGSIFTVQIKKASS